MTVRELVEQLNSISINFKGIKTHTGFHVHVREVFLPFIPKGLSIQTWGIYQNSYKIADYSRDFYAYKNSKYQDRGVFSNFRFSAALKFADSDISVLKTMLKEQEKLNYIVRLKLQISDLENELQKTRYLLKREVSK